MQIEILTMQALWQSQNQGKNAHQFSLSSVNPFHLLLSCYRTFLPLPGRDEQGRKVILIRATIHNPYVHKQDTVFKVLKRFSGIMHYFKYFRPSQVMNMIVELMCRNDESISVTGVVAIVDLKGVGMGHALQMTPSIIRKAVNSWQVHRFTSSILHSKLTHLFSRMYIQSVPKACITSIPHSTSTLS